MFYNFTIKNKNTNKTFKKYETIRLITASDAILSELYMILVPVWLG